MVWVFREFPYIRKKKQSSHTFAYNNTFFFIRFSYITEAFAQERT